MKIRSTPQYIAQIIQNSVFWTRAMHELRYADSHLIVSRSRFTDMMSADLTDRERKIWHNEMHITQREYREFVRYLVSHARKHGNDVSHDVNFAEGKNIGGRPFGSHNTPQPAVIAEDVEQEKKFEYSSLKDEKWGTPVTRTRAPAGIQRELQQEKQNSEKSAPVKPTLAPNRFYIGSHKAKKEEEKE